MSEGLTALAPDVQPKQYTGTKRDNNLIIANTHQELLCIGRQKSLDDQKKNRVDKQQNSGRDYFPSSCSSCSASRSMFEGSCSNFFNFFQHNG